MTASLVPHPHASDLARFGNLIARARRQALGIIGDGKPNCSYRLKPVGERLLASFGEIDKFTTVEQRLELIGANPADARRHVKPGDDTSMLNLLWTYGLEWSATNRGDTWPDLERYPLYWAISEVLLDWLCTDEARPGVHGALQDMFGVTFAFWAGDEP